MAIETNMLRNAREQMGGTAQRLSPPAKNVGGFDPGRYAQQMGGTAPTQMTEAGQARMARRPPDFEQRFREYEQQRQERVNRLTLPQAVTPQPYASRANAYPKFDPKAYGKVLEERYKGGVVSSSRPRPYGSPVTLNSPIGPESGRVSVMGASKPKPVYSVASGTSSGSTMAPRATTAPGQQPTFGQYSDEQVRGMQSTFAQAQSARNLRDQMPGYKPSRMQMEASKIPARVPYSPTPEQLAANRANAMRNYNPAQFTRQQLEAQIREAAWRGEIVGAGEGLGRR